MTDKQIGDQAMSDDGDPSIHGRIAKALGWTIEDARSMSLRSLRELVRPVSKKLAYELDLMIR